MKKKYILIALIAIVAVLLFLVSSFAFDVQRLHQNGALIYPRSVHGFYRFSQRLATLSDVKLIAGWMTFSYVNKSFSLPADYLKNTLGISDSKYPNLTIFKVAGELGTTTQVELQAVKTTVSSYLSQNPQPKTASTSPTEISPAISTGTSSNK